MTVADEVLRERELRRMEAVNKELRAMLPPEKRMTNTITPARSLNGIPAYGTMLKATELQLGDVVELSEGPYGCGTVKQIKDEMITFFRPYVATADFSYTGGVICYIGIEESSRTVNPRETYKFLSRTSLK